jgi:Spy/CpxP family protein refolding chaperone
MSEATRLRISATLILVLVFGSGILVGLALDRAVSTATGAPADPTEMVSEDAEVVMEEEPARGYVIDEVTMVAEQRQQVESILEAYREQVAQAAERHREEFSDLAAATREAFYGILSDAQKAQYDSLLDVRRAERDAAAGAGQDGR